MTEKKWTPGPWEANPSTGLCRGDEGCWNNIGPVYGSSQIEISEVFCSEADAHLITASPDMADALEDAPIIETYYMNGVLETERFLAHYDKWWEQRNAALAKARGEKL
jgi:hypothetical protein